MRWLSRSLSTSSHRETFVSPLRDCFVSLVPGFESKNTQNISGKWRSFCWSEQCRVKDDVAMWRDMISVRKRDSVIFDRYDYDLPPQFERRWWKMWLCSYLPKHNKFTVLGINDSFFLFIHSSINIYCRSVALGCPPLDTRTRRKIPCPKK